MPLILVNPIHNARLRQALEGLNGVWLIDAVATAAMAIALAGLIVTARERLRVWHLYVGLFLGFVLWFPWEPTRYACTLTPWLAYALVAGAMALAHHPRVPRGGPIAATALLALAVAGLPMRAGGLLLHPRFHDDLLPPHETAMLADRAAFSAWARATLPPDALLIHERNPLAWLDTGRQGLSIGHPPPLDAATQALVRARPTFLVIFPTLPEYGTAHKALLASIMPARPVYEAPAGMLEVYALPR